MNLSAVLMACSQRRGSAFYSSLALAPCLPSTDALEIFAKLGANIRNVYTVLNAQDPAWHLNLCLEQPTNTASPPSKACLLGPTNKIRPSSYP